MAFCLALASYFRREGPASESEFSAASRRHLVLTPCAGSIPRTGSPRPSICVPGSSLPHRGVLWFPSSWIQIYNLFFRPCLFIYPTDTPCWALGQARITLEHGPGKVLAQERGVLCGPVCTAFVFCPAFLLRRVWPPREGVSKILSSHRIKIMLHKRTVS